MGQPGLGIPGRASHWGQEQSRTGRRWRRGGHRHPEPGLGAVLVPTATYCVLEQIQGSELAGFSSTRPGQQDRARGAASHGPIFSLCLWLRTLVASPCPCPRAACTPLPATVQAGPLWYHRQGNSGPGRGGASLPRKTQPSAHPESSARPGRRPYLSCRGCVAPSPGGESADTASGPHHH